MRLSADSGERVGETVAFCGCAFRDERSSKIRSEPPRRFFVCVPDTKAWCQATCVSASGASAKCH